MLRVSEAAERQDRMYLTRLNDKNVIGQAVQYETLTRLTPSMHVVSNLHTGETELEPVREQNPASFVRASQAWQHAFVTGQTGQHLSVG